MKLSPLRSIAYLVATIAFLFCAPARADEDVFEWTYRYLAANATNDGQLYSAMVGISRTPTARTRENYDVLAQLLVEIAKDEPSTWKNSGPNLAKMLSNTAEAARYHTVLESVRGSFAPPGSRNEYLKKLRVLAKQNAEQYLPGTIDIAALRDGYARAALAATPTMAQALTLADLPKEVTIKELFAVAGNPAHVGIMDANISDIVWVDLRQLWFYYRGIGRVTFEYRREGGWYYKGVVIEPMTFEGLMPYRARAREFGLPSADELAMAQLLSGNPSAIKASAQAMRYVEDIPVEYLDTAADVLVRDMEIVDFDTADSYAWLCEVLAERGGRRYARVLAMVESKTTERKLKRYAGQVIERGGPEGIFTPGKVSLDALKAKHPTLYPQITLERGAI